MHISNNVFSCLTCKNRTSFLFQFCGILCHSQILVINYRAAMSAMHYINDPCLMKQVVYFTIFNYRTECWKSIYIVEAARF